MSTDHIFQLGAGIAIVPPVGTHHRLLHLAKRDSRTLQRECAEYGFAP